MKRSILLLIAIFTLFILVGCAQPAEPVEPAEPAPPAAPAEPAEEEEEEPAEQVQEPPAPLVEELTIMWWNDGTEGFVMQTLLNRYEAETGIEGILIESPFADYESRLATMIAGGRAPHLARMTEGHLNNFRDKLLPLDDAFNADEFTNVFKNPEGQVMGLPMDVTANGLFVNLDLLEKHGVNFPRLGDEIWTWEEFETEMSKLKGQEGIPAPGLFDHQAHRFMPLLYQAGINIWDTPYTVSNLPSPEAVATVEKLMRWYREGFLCNQTYVVKNSASLFRTGTYGFHMSGNWNVSAYQDLPFRWTVIPMPQGVERSTVLGGKHKAAFVDSGADEASLSFIGWLAQGVNHDQFTNGVPYLTPRLGAEVNYGRFEEQYAVFLDEIANTSSENINDWLRQVRIPGMFPVINQFVETAANPANTKTALELLQELELSLMEIMKE